MKTVWSWLLAGVLTLLFMWYVCTGFAEERPATMDAIAVKVLTVAYEKHPHYYEYGGVIVMGTDGKLNASLPLTDGHVDNISIEEDPEQYGGVKDVVGDYHTHPCVTGYVTGVFSPADLRSSRAYGKPSYILDECTGNVIRWSRGDPTRVYDEDLTGDIVADGTIVGHVNVTGEKIVL